MWLSRDQLNFESDDSCECAFSADFTEHETLSERVVNNDEMNFLLNEIMSTLRLTNTCNNTNQMTFFEENLNSSGRVRYGDDLERPGPSGMQNLLEQRTKKSMDLDSGQIDPRTVKKQNDSDRTNEPAPSTKRAEKRKSEKVKDDKGKKKLKSNGRESRSYESIRPIKNSKDEESEESEESGSSIIVIKDLEKPGPSGMQNLLRKRKQKTRYLDSGLVDPSSAKKQKHSDNVLGVSVRKNPEAVPSRINTKRKLDRVDKEKKMMKKTNRREISEYENDGL